MHTGYAITHVLYSTTLLIIDMQETCCKKYHRPVGARMESPPKIKSKQIFQVMDSFFIEVLTHVPGTSEFIHKYPLFKHGA